MNENQSDIRKKLGGPTARSIVIVMALLFLIVQWLIIGTFLEINKITARSSKVQRSYSTYIEEATSIIGGSSLLSETSTNFILSPLNEANEVNVSPLQAYATEFPSDRRPAATLERFKTYDVSEEVLNYMILTCNSADAMIDAQLHALALVDSVYGIPKDPPLDVIPFPELSAEEKAMPAEARLGKARALVFGSDYQINKASVSSNSGLCVSTLRRELAVFSQQISMEVLAARNRMWALTFVLLGLIILSFIGVFVFFVRPIRSATRNIVNDENISEKHGVREFRVMSHAYNNLLTRRNALEGILRSAAATDTLTGLENRYAFETYSLDADESEGPLAVVFFDLNFLKKVNDEQGHSAGDRLLCSAADCITGVFGCDEGNNCFRIGGDEFVAILPKIQSQEELDRMAERFVEDQKKRDISIAWGCAFTEDIAKTTIKSLVDTADRNLYECKRRMHEEAE